jgi:hypothetical protein
VAIKRWSLEAAQAWSNAQGPLIGCNFLPAYAINQIEMWAAETFDERAIRRELAWAKSCGFNTLRIYLHDLVFASDAIEFLDRIDLFLEIAEEHSIRPLIVLFDDCWHEPRPGIQPAPRPGIHNSGWARSPGSVALNARSEWPRLETYVRSVIGQFANDTRILGWDIYNEVTNDWMPLMSLPSAARDAAMPAAEARHDKDSRLSIELMKAAFEWAREQDPVQPLTSGQWNTEAELNALLANLSDIISFHHYRSPESLERQIDRLKAHGRPLWCTEFLSRTDGCTFQSHLPIFAKQGIACWNWGLVDGKSQTKYAWRDQGGTAEPTPWFHDVLRADGSPYDGSEIDLIREFAAQDVGGE